MGDADMSVLVYRVNRVEKAQDGLAGRLGATEREMEGVHTALQVHTEQISGVGGLQKSVAAARDEIAGLRRAFYSLTASLIVASFAIVGAIVSHAL